MRDKPEIGQTLFSLNVGNAARHKKQVLTPVKVTKVGRKYFTVGEDWIETQYHLDDWQEKSEYIAGSVLFASEQEWEDEKDSNILFERLSDYFDHSGRARRLPLPVLKTIDRIIGEAFIKGDI